MRKGIERAAELGHQRCEAPAEGIGGGEHEVDIDAVEAVVLDELHGAGDELRARGGVGDEGVVTILRVGPAADGEQDLQVPGRDGLASSRGS